MKIKNRRNSKDDYCTCTNSNYSFDKYIGEYKCLSCFKLSYRFYKRKIIYIKILIILIICFILLVVITIVNLL